MSVGQLVDVLVLVVVVVVMMGTERVREAHQAAQGAAELGVRMLENPTVHARRAGVKERREAVWLNMQSKEGRGKKVSGAEGGEGKKNKCEGVKKMNGEEEEVVR